MPGNGDDVTIRFTGSDAGLGATVGLLAQELQRLKGELAKVTQETENSSSGFKNASKDVTQLANTLGTSYKNAQQFASGLELTASQANQALGKLKKLNSVGATNAEKFRALAKELGTTHEQFEQLNKTANTTKERLTGLAGASAAVAAGIGSLAAKGVQSFAAFDGAIRTLGVVTSSSAEQVAKVRAQIENLAKVTTKTPQEIADTAVELGKAGFNAEQLAAALPGVVQSSEATGESLQRTGEVIGAILNQFALDASKSGEIADLLTAASNASAAGTSDLGEAFNYVGAQAKASNQTFKDTITTLALLANAGIKGSAAGTGLAEALRRLKLASANATTEFQDLRSKGSKTAVAAFDQLNASVRDAQGNLKPFPEILASIKTSLGSVKEQGDKELILNALFGTTGGRVVQSLLNQTESQIDQVKSAIDNFEGSAKTSSQQLTQGLGPAMTLFGSSAQLAEQKVGEFIAVGLEPLIRAATEVVNAFIALPAPLQAVLIGTGALVGVFSAAVAVVTAYKLLNIATTAALVAETAAELARTVAVGAGTAAQLLFNTQLTLTDARLAAVAAAQGIATIAQTAYAAATANAAAVTGALTTAVTALLIPLAALGAGVALTGIVKFNEQMQDTLDGLNTVGNSIEGAAQTGIRAQFALKQSIDAVNAAKKNSIALSEQEKQKAEQAQKQAEQALVILQDQLKQAEAVPQAKATLGGLGQAEADAANRARQANIDSLNQQIAAIERQRDALKQATESQTDQTKATKQSKEDLQALADAEKQRRDAAKVQAESAEQDKTTERQQQFQDQSQARERSFQLAQQSEEEKFKSKQQAEERTFKASQQKDEEQFKAAQLATERSFKAEQQKQEKSFSKAQQSEEKQFSRQQQAEEKQFTKQQQAEAKAFQDELAQRDKQRAKTFEDAQRLLALRSSALLPEEKDKLRQQEQLQNKINNLRLADRNLSPEEIANLAKQVSGIFNAGTQDQLNALQNAAKLIEAKQQEQQKELDRKREEEFQAKQQAAQAAFTKVQQAEQEQFQAKQEKAKEAFTAKQQAAEQAFSDAQKAQETAFKAQQQAQEQAFSDAQKQAERQFKAEQNQEETAFKASEREKERAFKAQERELERQFKEQQRQLDEASAAKVKALKKEAKDAPNAQPASTAPTPPTGSPPPEGRFKGGAVDGGTPYWVGEDPASGRILPSSEIIVPGTSSYVVAASKAQEWLRGTAAPANMPAPSGAGMGSLLEEIRDLKATIAARNPQMNVQANFPTTQETDEERWFRTQRAMLKGLV